MDGVRGHSRDGAMLPATDLMIARLAACKNRLRRIREDGEGTLRW
jgi:hypothetical protein